MSQCCATPGVIVITGIGASGLVAQNFAWKLLKIGINAVVERDMHALLATVQALAQKICCWRSLIPGNGGS
ncbi:transcriptional regulator [Salmonella bongori]|nr:transcriptional regulator [Salmonella bongori]